MAEINSICLRGRCVHLDGPSGWQLPLAEVVLIGEATTTYGSFEDDHFLCCLDGEACFLAPITARGLEQFLVGLERAGRAVHVEQCKRAVFSSQILWPPAYSGAPLFLYEPTWTCSRWGRAVCWLFGWRRSMIQTYSPAVEAFLQTLGREVPVSIRVELPV